jgi:glucose/arabinose dehydrogenase
MGCGGDGGDARESGGIVPVPAPTPSATASSTPPPAPVTTTAVTQTPVATFENPWAMVFLPDGRLLVTEKPGRLRLVTTAGQVSTVSGVPAVVNAGQGGLLDVALDPGFASNRRVYLSYAEAGTGGSGLAVARGTLAADGSALGDMRVIWRQDPKVSGDGHFGGRMAFAPDGRLFVTAGERQKGTPAQDLAQTLGKVIRIEADGSIPADNPFAGQAGAKAEIWSYGHRNPYGLVFAGDGRLFESEMGPEGGDEFNLIERGRNYGWPAVSEGNNYGGGAIPRHATDSRYAAPLVSWTPVISPGGMIQYRGSRFVNWEGDFLLAGLTGQGLIRVRVSGATASEAARIPLGTRIREVEQGPDGAIWVLGDGATGRLIRLDPA